jgi:hypothetical protein
VKFASLLTQKESRPSFGSYRQTLKVLVHWFHSRYAELKFEGCSSHLGGQERTLLQLPEIGVLDWRNVPSSEIT